MTRTKYIDKQSKLLFRPLYSRIVMLLMLFSYFYNLPVLNYSVKGNNELRLYDLVGVLVLMIVVLNRPFVVGYIKSKTHFRYLNNFMLWCGFSLIFTAAFSLAKGRPLWIIQTFLYYYHFLVFFFTAVLLSLYLRVKGNYRWLASFILILATAEAILVFLQHYRVVPFLWNDIYKSAYGLFLSGTLGPNKIVLGMVMFITLTFATGLLFQKQLKVNRILIITTITVCLATIIISGSRTTYLALLVYLCYLFISTTKKFFVLSVVISLAVMVGFFLNLELIETAVTTIQNRVIDKVSDPQAFKENNIDVIQLYEDLGAGRDRLSLIYLDYIFRNPYVIPFGIGLNNRLLVGYSAHNIYLSLINEVGLVGLFLYSRWLTSYFYLKLGKMRYLKLALNGLIISMLVTLFFGEHLYIYRPLFGILGYFLVVTILFISPRYYFKSGR
ncbi:O-antigen ligase family protein [Hyunsoonleella pacifica]|uniref:O-antigen ligase-related domain-containing protein n=1 Tax=Hyunsoonleella pacifica TaxID=1080224 RepID=A0A4Q9FRJ7_9FLAO|nr:O-antigen ligase family protein [Hyunsoonleella pacifica]TBN18527.1 hypothetical protein EYD46_00215 [Hyunsoonleella pacifica]